MMRSIVLLLVIATGVLAKTKTATIRYKQGTMGIETIEGEKGWQITFIHPVEPGQPNLNVGDMITGIAGNSFLGMEYEEQNDLFEAYIGDGVEMDVEPVQDIRDYKNNPRRKYHYFCDYTGCLKDGWREFLHVDKTGTTTNRWWEHRDGKRSNYKPSHPASWHESTWAFLSGRHNYEPAQQLKQGAKKVRRRGPTFDVPPENCCYNPVEREDGMCENNWRYKTVKGRYVYPSVKVHHKFRKGKPSLKDEFLYGNEL